MKHLNDLSATFDDLGLSVLGITRGDSKNTESWAKKQGMKYAYAYDYDHEGTGRLMEKLGLTSRPAAVMVTPDGLVAWTGDPRSLQRILVRKALDGALPRALWDWPASAKPVVQAIQKKKYAKAIALARQIALKTQDEEIDAIGNAIIAIVANKVTKARARFEAGDYLAAQETATSLVKQLMGLPESSQAKDLLTKIKKTPGAAKIIKAQKTLRKIAVDAAGVTEAKKIERLIKKTQSAVAKLVETYPNARAKELLKRLRAGLNK